MGWGQRALNPDLDKIDAMELNLVEEETLFIPGGQLCSQYLDLIAKTYPTYFSMGGERSRGEWAYFLRSKGYIGLFPLRGSGLLRVEPKIPSLSVWKMITASMGVLEAMEPEKVHSVAGLSHALVTNYVRIVGERLDRGLLWDYRSAEEGGRPIRGRIIGPEVKRLPLVRCRYDEGGYDHKVNQKILWTLHIMGSMVLEQELFDRIRRLIRELTPKVSLKLVAEDLTLIRFPRLYSEYRTLNILSEFILAHSSPVISSGPKSTLPFIFHMPTLFEEAVAGWMHRSFSGRVVVKRQWSIPLKGVNSLCFKIDLALLAKETLQPLVIFDTKYKRDRSPSTADVHQVASYAVETGAMQAVLLFPQKNIEHTEFFVGPIKVQTLGFDFQKTDWSDIALDIYNFVDSLIESHK